MCGNVVLHLHGASAVLVLAKIFQCNGPDLSTVCQRCGENGHKKKLCTSGDDRYVDCERAGAARTAYRLGSGAYVVRKSVTTAKVSGNLHS